MRMGVKRAPTHLPDWIDVRALNTAP